MGLIRVVGYKAVLNIKVIYRYKKCDPRIVVCILKIATVIIRSSSSNSRGISWYSSIFWFIIMMS